jgi:hypothetical protein
MLRCARETFLEYEYLDRPPAASAGFTHPP